MNLTQREIQRKLQREKLRNLGERFYTACLYVGYTIAAVVIFGFFYVSFPLWFAIIGGIPVAIFGAIPFGIPLGGIPALIIVVLYNWLIDVFLPDFTEPKKR